MKQQPREVPDGLFEVCVWRGEWGSGHKRAGISQKVCNGRQGWNDQWNQRWSSTRILGVSKTVLPGRRGFLHKL
jgi:hypothetical protein